MYEKIIASGLFVFVAIFCNASSYLGKGGNISKLPRSSHAARIVTCFSTSISSLRYSLAAPLNADGPDTTTRTGGGMRATAASTISESSLRPRRTSANFASEASALSASVEDPCRWFGNGTPDGSPDGSPEGFTAGGVRSTVQCRTPSCVMP